MDSKEKSVRYGPKKTTPHAQNPNKISQSSNSQPKRYIDCELQALDAVVHWEYCWNYMKIVRLTVLYLDLPVTNFIL